MFRGVQLLCFAANRVQGSQAVPLVPVGEALNQFESFQLPNTGVTGRSEHTVNRHLPIWTEFLKRALDYPGYRDAKKFPVPSGIARVNLCSESRQLATPGCSATYPEYFVDGSQSADQCQLHSTSQPNSDASEPSADLRGNPGF
jgi:membrane carboxypeptidase/penicillin-binding protein